MIAQAQLHGATLFRPGNVRQTEHAFALLPFTTQAHANGFAQRNAPALLEGQAHLCCLGLPRFIALIASAGRQLAGALPLVLGRTFGLRLRFPSGIAAVVCGLSLKQSQPRRL